LATPDRAPAPRRTGNRPLDKDRVKAKVKDKAAAIDVVVVAVVEAKAAKAAKVANRATRTVPLTHPSRRPHRKRPARRARPVAARTSVVAAAASVVRVPRAAT